MPSPAPSRRDPSAYRRGYLQFSQDFVIGHVAVKSLTFSSVFSFKTLTGTTVHVVKRTAGFGALGKGGRANVGICKRKRSLLMDLCACVMCDIHAPFPWCI